jgi:hypothetical protein
LTRIISFKNTSLFKRGIWLSAAALIACVAAPSVLNGALWRNPAVNVIQLVVLGGFLAYFLRKMRIYRLVDEVADCGDHLKIRRGRTEVSIPLSVISTADVSTNNGIHRITLHLRELTKLGGKIEFLPQASLWSSPGAVKRVATDLTERAGEAKLQLGRASGGV